MYLNYFIIKKKERGRKRNVCACTLFPHGWYGDYATFNILYICMHACVLLLQSCPTLWTPWSVACQALLFTGFSRQEYWSGFPCPLLRYLPNSGTEPTSPVSSALQGDSLLLNTREAPYIHVCVYMCVCLCVCVYMYIPGGSDGKESACNAGDPGSIPWVRQDPLEKGMATHSSILTWRVPWTEEPGGLLSTGLQRDAHDWAAIAHSELTYSIQYVYTF